MISMARNFFNAMNHFSLSGKKGLIVGMANQQSIAYGCAMKVSKLGGTCAVTYANEKTKEFISPLLSSINCDILAELDVTNESHVHNIFEMIAEKWGDLDFLIHSIAFANKDDLHGKVLNSSKAGFLEAMDVSCHSLIRLSQKASQLMKNGGSIITMSYLGAELAVQNYGIMGPVKAALESSVRYLSMELGEKNIRVNAISPGAIKTRAASGIANFDTLLKNSQEKSFINSPLNIEDVGNMAAFLISDASRMITGETIYIDGGNHISG